MILGIGGYATAGKDEVAKHLENKHGWVRCGCSTGLEKALLILNPYIPNDDLHDGIERYSEMHARVGYEKSKEHEEVRRLLQTLGTEVGRNFLGDEEIWIRWLFDNIVIPEAMGNGKNVVITGVRYPSELAMVNKFFGQTMWVRRRDVGPINDHTSEHSLNAEQFTWQLANHGSIEDLQLNVDKWLLKLLTEDDVPEEPSV